MDKTKYEIYKVQDDITVIDDYSDATLYVVEGDTEAIVIDTAMGDGNLPELIRKNVTEKPLKLLVTHGHGDHVMHAGEFDAFYMSKKDNVFFSNMSADEEEILEKKEIDLKGMDVISVSGVSMTVIEAFGHTPGSVLFADLERKAVFTGDAFGSGCGVWMQVNFGLSVSEYQKSLEKVLEDFTRLGIDDSFTFYGGHILQKGMSKVSDNNPVCIDLIKDMISLCKGLLSGDIKGEASDARHFSEEEPKYASFGKAEMIYLPSKVK